MKSIEEQLKNIGLVKARKDKEPTTNNTINLPELVSGKLIELIVNKESFGRMHSFLTKNQLLISSKTKKKLKTRYTESIESNLLDANEIISFISKIDFELANKNFLQRKERRKASRKNKKKINHNKLRPLVNHLGAQMTTQDKIEQLRATSSIGLGLNSNQKLLRVMSSEVRLDKNTTIDDKYDKSILYAAGFSLKNNSESES